MAQAHMMMQQIGLFPYQFTIYFPIMKGETSVLEDAWIAGLKGGQRLNDFRQKISESYELESV